ncbi:hypothetical protein ACX27_04255 [Nostoc piscinale CENA21]|uniref:Uncharacterized protein n=1 Tax=Nostoc piscinale CENA21 TaxID=224013 RepID=A0A0M3V4J2_9NOSO|nr:hypothetical protein [Nostoc piscinale]ALF52243.1 hypothetical protein ACX27_04255 [Nostoc piscinale CENA21]
MAQAQVLIEYNPSRFYPPRSGPWIAGSVTFVPGVKSYEASDWESLTSHPVLAGAINSCVEEGILRIISQSSKSSLSTEPEVPPLPKNQSEAIALVKRTYSMSLLQGWQKIEKRAKVQQAIKEQMTTDTPQVNVPPPEETEGQGSGGAGEEE